MSVSILRNILLFPILLCAVSVTAHVNLNQPVGGETYSPGQKVKIVWEVAIAHDTQNWDLFWSSDGGATYEAIKVDIDKKTLSYQWTVPYHSGTQTRIKVVQDNTGGDYDDKSGNFTISGVATAASSDGGGDGLKLFPNPVSGMLYLTTPGASPAIKNIFVLDPSGRMMDQSNHIPTGGIHRTAIDVSHWPAGHYWMAIRKETGVEIRKFIIF